MGLLSINIVHKMTIDETVIWFNAIYLINSTTTSKREDFICGVTGNLDKCKQDLGVERLLGVTKCDSPSTAQKLIEKMKEQGYSISNPGSNNDENIFVFLHKRSTNNESISEQTQENDKPQQQ